MTEQRSAFGQDFGKQVLRVALAVVGLLILRAILGALPMLKNASTIGSTFISPLVIINAVIDTVILLALLRLGLVVGRSISEHYVRLPDLGRIVSLAVAALALAAAYEVYQKPAACLLMSGTDFGKCQQLGALTTGMDFAAAIQQLTQAAAQAVAQAQNGALVAGLQESAANCLVSVYPAYGWTFLVLIAIPVVMIVVLVSRNLDAITETLFHAATAPPRPVSASYSGAARPSGPGPAGDGASAGDAIEKLAKLKSLLDAGVISKEEFEGQKAAILGSSPASSPTTAEPEELRKLKSLFDAGALTQEEYEAQRRRILAAL